MVRALALILALASAQSWAGAPLKKELVGVEAVRDESRWTVSYSGAERWSPGKSVYLTLPPTSGNRKLAVVGLFVVDAKTSGNRYELRLTKKMGSFRRGRKGERLFAVFRSSEAVVEREREPAAMESTEEVPASPRRQSRDGESNRMAKRFGLTLGIGEPVGTLAALGLHYNIVDFLSLSGHFGITPFGVVTTLGASGGLKLYVPGWSLTPFVYPSVAWFKVSIDTSQFGGANFFGTALANGDSTFFFNVPFGLAWQAKPGFSVQLSGNLLALSTFSGASGLALGLHLGWFF